MDTMDTSIDTPTVGPVVTAAADVLMVRPNAAPSSSHGQIQISSCSPTFAKPGLRLTCAHVYCTLVRVDISSVQLRAGPRTDGKRNQLCELCGRRLVEVKHTKPCGIGRACKHGCKQLKHPLHDTGQQRATSAERPAKKQRRTQSDPGEPIILTPNRMRVRAPKPPPPRPKPRSTKPTIDPSALLDAAHAHRMALMEAESKIGLTFEENS
jgi:hypothetical protein